MGSFQVTSISTGSWRATTSWWFTEQIKPWLYQVLLCSPRPKSQRQANFGSSLAERPAQRMKHCAQPNYPPGRRLGRRPKSRQVTLSFWTLLAPLKERFIGSDHSEALVISLIV